MASPVSVPTARATRNWIACWKSQGGKTLIIATAARPQPDMNKTLNPA